jgi:hypothetical protein
MNNNNYNDYFLTQSKWKSYMTLANEDRNNKTLNNNYKTSNKIIWLKTILI